MQSWTTGASVVRDAGILKQDVAYADIIDMQFVKSIQRAIDDVCVPVGLDEGVAGVGHAGVCHGDLLVVTDTSPKAITRKAAL